MAEKFIIAAALFVGYSGLIALAIVLVIKGRLHRRTVEEILMEADARVEAADIAIKRAEKHATRKLNSSWNAGYHSGYQTAVTDVEEYINKAEASEQQARQMLHYQRTVNNMLFVELSNTLSPVQVDRIKQSVLSKAQQTDQHQPKKHHNKKKHSKQRVAYEEAPRRAPDDRDAPPEEEEWS